MAARLRASQSAGHALRFGVICARRVWMVSDDQARLEDVVEPLLSGHARESLSCCLVALLSLAAGCADPGSSQATSTPTVRFGDFPAGGVADGKTIYKPVLGTVEGTGSRTFAIAPRTGMMFWVSCIGTGMVELDSRDIQLNNDWACDKTGNISAWQIDPTRAAAGRKVTFHLTAPAETRWALRVDATSHLPGRKDRMATPAGRVCTYLLGGYG
jgi:hypothetical protein